MSSTQPRKQHWMQANLPVHLRSKRVSVSLSKDLTKKYGLIQANGRMPVHKGDTVRILRGSFRGEQGKVILVDLGNARITIEGQILTKADGKQKPRRFPPSNLMIVRLNLTDEKRREMLRRRGASAAVEAEPEEEAKGEGKEAADDETAGEKATGADAEDDGAEPDSDEADGKAEKDGDGEDDREGS